MAKRKHDGSIVQIIEHTNNKRKGDDLSCKMNKKLRIVKYWHQMDLSREERAKYMALIYMNRINTKE